MQPYRFKVRHIPGKENIADTLSRLTDQHTKSCEKLCTETEEYVRFVAENATACSLSTREIEGASAIDQELSNIRECIQKGQWETLENKRYLMVRSKLCHWETSTTRNSDQSLIACEKEH